MSPRIALTDEDRRFGREFFTRYKAKEGSEHIANERALAYLSATLRTYRPRVVLECGAGIGTMTDAILSHECGVDRVIAVEHNAFCLAAVAANLNHHDSGRLTVVARREELSELDLSVDMIVGDGGYGKRETFRFARSGTVIFVEGGRGGFREQCRQFLAERNLSITFAEHGATRRFKRTFFPRFHLPAIKLRTVIKGCWIGQAKPRRSIVSRLQGLLFRTS